MLNILPIGKKTKNLILTFFIVLTSCSHPLKSRVESSSTEENKPIIPYALPKTQPEPVLEAEKKEPGIALYFTEGYARGFAYQGVLKQLENWKIKITEIHAVDIGALVATAYVVEGNSNRMDWILSKFTENTLNNQSSGLIFNGLESLESRLEKKLTENFLNIKSENFKIPLIYENVENNDLSAWEKIRISLTQNNKIKPYKNYFKIEDRKEINKNQKNKIIIIKTVQSNQSKMVEMKKNESLIIEIGIPDFSDDDYKRKSQAAYYGRSQLEKFRKEIFEFLAPGDTK